MQAARYLVGVSVEFSAGMQLGHDDLGGRFALFCVDIYGDTAAIVGNRDRFAGVNGDRNLTAKSGECLVDFTLAYTPFCAYGDRWSCPVPPTENRLSVRIEAGEKRYK